MSAPDLTKTTLGAFTRLSTEPNELLVRYFYADRSANTPEQFDAYIDMTLAHVVMLAHQEIVSPHDGAALASALKTVRSMGVEGFPADPRLTETVLQVEHFVVSVVGPDVGGNLHIGRSRCDLSPSISRLALRRRLVELLERLLDLRETTLSIAAEHTRSVMPGYTHLQHAQPLTFGHYLVAFADAIERDYRRLRDAMRTVNESPLGTAATATTSWPVDRLILADLLGYEALVENSRDAGCAKDYLVQTLSSAAMLMASICRLATDLWLWSTFEFGMVELADEFTGTSSAMPQKKNPYPLEVLRFRYDQVVGDVMVAMTALKGPAHIDSESLLLDTSREPAMHAIRYTVESVHMMTELLRTLIVKKERMRELAGANFAQALDIADAIAQKGTGISWRTAHHVVGRAVRTAVDDAVRPSAMDLDMLDAASEAILGRPTGLTGSELSAALDPEAIVERHSVIGGPASTEVVRQLDVRTPRLRNDREELQGFQRRLADRASQLDAEVEQLLEASPAPVVGPDH